MLSALLVLVLVVVLVSTPASRKPSSSHKLGTERESRTLRTVDGSTKMKTREVPLLLVFVLFSVS